MFEKTRTKTAMVLRKGDSLGYVKVEPFSPDVNSKVYAYMNGIDVSLQAYVSKEIPIQVFDVLQYESKSYKIVQITEYSSFYFVLGEKII